MGRLRVRLQDGTFQIDPRSGAIKWAQYSQIISEREMSMLLARARDKGWRVFGV